MDRTKTMQAKKSFPFSTVAYLCFALLAGIYFSYAAVKGDYGVFKRAEINGEIHETEAKLDETLAEVARMENLIHRLSDDYLDLDLLDERARYMLGQMRGDEITIP